MVMRIDDRAGGIDDLLGILCEPVFARIGVEPASGGGCSTGGHECRSPDCYCSSLRATGSGECPPDDRLREAIHLSACRTMDCFAALAMTAAGICERSE